MGSTYFSIPKQPLIVYFPFALALLSGIFLKGGGEDNEISKILGKSGGEGTDFLKYQWSKPKKGGYKNFKCGGRDYFILISHY